MFQWGFLTRPRGGWCWFKCEEVLVDWLSWQPGDSNPLPVSDQPTQETTGTRVSAGSMIYYMTVFEGPLEADPEGEALVLLQGVLDLFPASLCGVK